MACARRRGLHCIDPKGVVQLAVSPHSRSDLWADASAKYLSTPAGSSGVDMKRKHVQTPVVTDGGLRVLTDSKTSGSKNLQVFT